jgi:hypothetical protein
MGHRGQNTMDSHSSQQGQPQENASVVEEVLAEIRRRNCKTAIRMRSFLKVGGHQFCTLGSVLLQLHCGRPL